MVVNFPRNLRRIAGDMRVLVSEIDRRTQSAVIFKVAVMIIPACHIAFNDAHFIR